VTCRLEIRRNEEVQPGVGCEFEFVRTIERPSISRLVDIATQRRTGIGIDAKPGKRYRVVGIESVEAIQSKDGLLTASSPSVSLGLIDMPAPTLVSVSETEDSHRRTE
jgi:hypothetical protein